MRVALVGPDLEENLSIRYLASALTAAGHAPTIVPFETRDDLARARAAAADAELVGLSMCYQIRAREFLDLAAALKRDRPELPIVAGGHFASCAARELLDAHPALDVVAIHEGEQTLVELASLPAEWSAEVLAGVRGIAYRGAAGDAIYTPARGIVDDLDTLPWPDRSGPARLVVGVPTSYMMGSRGCVGACDYCAITTLHRLAPGKRFRQRDPEQVAEEVAALYHDRGVRQFVFHDDNFLLPSAARNLERIEAIDRGLRRRGVRRIGLVLKCRPADVDAGVFRRLREMGLLRVFLGIESGTPEGLASLGRHDQDVAQAHRALDVCRSLEISAQYTVIIFHPEATPATMQADLSFVRQHLDHPLSFCRAEAYAGTPLEARMIEAGRARGSYLGREYSYTDPTTAVIWDAARQLLRDRCWSQDNLLGQSIRLDHLAAVYEHFYEGRDVDRLVGDFRAWELEVNRDSVTLFEELIAACVAVPDAGSPVLAAKLEELAERERATTAVLQRRGCELREALRAGSYGKLGLSPAVPAPSRAARLFAAIPRHAAAAVLAVGIAGCSGGDARKDDGGVIEAPPPPFDMRVDSVEDMGVIEAPPPPMDIGLPQDKGVSEDMGVIEAPPPPMDMGPMDIGVSEDMGVIEAPPPPMDMGPMDMGPIDQGVKDDFGVIEAPPPPFDLGPPKADGQGDS